MEGGGCGHMVVRARVGLCVSLLKIAVVGILQQRWQGRLGDNGCAWRYDIANCPIYDRVGHVRVEAMDLPKEWNTSQD